MAYLGIDLGTSGLRLLLVDEAGVPVASEQAHYRVSSPHPGWSEQDPNDWITALNSAVNALKERTPAFASVRAIGVAGHMHGAVLLDEQDAVLRPCILWNDTRSHTEAAELDTLPAFRAQSGNIVFPGFTAPKLEWVRKHEPDIHASIKTVLLPSAYLNLYLTGEAVGDVSDAAGSSWLDTGARAWSPELLAASNMHPEQMPRLVEGSTRAGQLRERLRQDWGLSQNVVIAGGGADNAAAACGMGVIAQGQGFVSLGTSGVVLTARDHYKPNADKAVHSFCHAIPNVWYQMGVMLAATDSLNWLSRITAQSPGALTAQLGPEQDAPTPLTFFPFLSGERTPYNDATLRGGFLGLSTQSDPAELTCAVLQGVCFGLRGCMDAISSGGPVPERLFAIGGGAASDYWLRMLATILNVPLERPVGGEFGAALGAARLAQCALTDQTPKEVMLPPQTVETFAPNPDLRDAFEGRYLAFKDSFEAVFERN